MITDLPRFLSMPIAFLYKIVVLLRKELYDRRLIKSYQCSVPVISVGNITVGGNGKTPLCIKLAKDLIKLNETPVVICRGYKAKLKGPLLVKPTHTVEEIGDEAFLLARACKSKVVVAKRKVDGIKFAEKQTLGTVFIIDDGFQHFQTKRDLDLVCIYTGNPVLNSDLINSRMLPLGRCREPSEGALDRGSAFILSNRDLGNGSPNSAVRNAIPKSKPVFNAFFSSQGVLALSGNEKLSPQNAIAFCGIANPDGFFNSLKELGFTLLATNSFADHHFFSQDELKEMKNRHPNTPLICSAKDAVKLDGFDLEDLYALQVELNLDQEDQWHDLLKQVINNENKRPNPRNSEVSRRAQLG